MGFPPLLCVLLVALTLWPCQAAAQGGQDSGGVSMEQRRRTQVIRPLPAAREVAEDAERALDQLEATQRQEALIRENLPRVKPSWADSDVRSGIQSRNIQNALPRR